MYLSGSYVVPYAQSHFSVDLDQIQHILLSTPWIVTDMELNF